MEKIRMMTDGGYKNNNQYVINKGIMVVGFQSYGSYCAEYDKVTNELTLFENWDYSRTTMKYLLRFLQKAVGMSINSITPLRKKKVIDGVKIKFADSEREVA